MGMLVNFQLDNVKANHKKGVIHWTEHGDSFSEWLGNLNCQDDTQVQQAGIQVSPPGQPALMDGGVDEPDILPRDGLAELESLSEP